MLPINFHKTFIPERRFIAELLSYAALGKEGDFQEIAAETGIPMGGSTGKVPAILDYAQGMGLIEVSEGARKGAKRPVLTALGRTVYSEDRFLGESIVQWLVHMNLCRPDIGASAWNSVFALGRSTLGSMFTLTQTETYLQGIYGPGRDRIGPLFSAYTEDAALGRAGVLMLKGEEIFRKRAPLSDNYASAYSAYILELMKSFFPGQGQVAVSDLQRETLWFDIGLWGTAEVERLLIIIERKGYLSIDKHMQPWIIEKKADADEVWPRIWDDIA